MSSVMNPGPPNMAGYAVMPNAFEQGLHVNASANAPVAQNNNNQSPGTVTHTIDAILGLKCVEKDDLQEGDIQIEVGKPLERAATTGTLSGSESEHEEGHGGDAGPRG